MNAPIFVEEEVLEKAGLDYQPQENEHSRNIKNLQIKLSQAIEREAFEEAAKIRDEIKTTLQQKPSEKQSQ